MRSPTRALCALGAVFLGCQAAAAATPAPIQIIVDGAAGGKVFEGIGAASGGGATTRLLIDYPEPQRSQILDYLFKPHYGASLQLLKVEIGSDGNSTEGAEPTHMRQPGGADFERGYEWWIMAEAKRRNPHIKLIALAWDFPGWVGKANSQATADYLVSFVDGARRVHGLTIDYLGIWNETHMDPQFIKRLRATLDAHGLSATKIVADDSVDSWGLVQEMRGDPALRRDVDVIATHYPLMQSTPEARASSREWQKPLWSSEDGPWGDVWGTAGQASPPLAELLNRNYIQGRITSTVLWCLVGSYYDIFDLPNAGLLRAKWPWSGHYQLASPLWVVAHTTQFAQPGWRYIDSASGLMRGGGSYVSLHHGADYSIVVETLEAAGPTRLDFKLTGGLGSGPVYVWRTNARHWFERIARLEPRAGRFSFVFAPDSVYTLTNTTGQAKGAAQSPPDKPFPMPYRDDFERYAANGAEAHYFFEANGAFETAPCGAGRPGRCLRQVTDQPPIGWTYYGDWPKAGTLAVLGDRRWRDYRVSADVLVERRGYAAVYGRVSGATGGGLVQGYQLRLHGSGRWELRAAADEKSVMASGQVAPALNVWRHLELAFDREHITASIDGRQVASLKDTRNSTGMAGLGSGWNPASFDDFAVTPLSARIPVISAPPLLPASAPPGAPAMLVPTAGDHSVRLQWLPVAGAAGYRVRMGTDPKHLGNTQEAGGALTYTFRTLTNGVKYYFDVTAWNSKGAGAHSGQYAAVPGPPGGGP